MGMQARNNRRTLRKRFWQQEVERAKKYKLSADLIRNVEPLKTPEDLLKEKASLEKKAREAAKAKASA